MIRCASAVGLCVQLFLLALPAVSAGAAELPTFAGPAMGTTYRVTLARDVAGQSLGELHRETDRLLARLDEQLSTWRKDSDASRFNAADAAVWVDVGDDLFRIVQLAQDLHRQTDGRFDITVGPLVRWWQSRLPGARGGALLNAEPPRSLLSRIGSELIESQPMNDERPGALRKLVPGLEIDLSAIGPGYAVDQIGERLIALGSAAHLVELGGEVRAWGRRDDGSPWRVVVRIAVADGVQRQVIELADGRALAVSAASGSRPVVDPRSGLLCSNATAPDPIIYADSCAEADALATVAALEPLPVPSRRPNIVFVMCDDLGFGDVHCLNPDHGRIPTPHADRLAAEGMVFTDAHSGSSVCTPTRYGLLTGRHCWRTRLQQGVVTGFAPCLIAADRPTVAGFLRDQGYRTSIVGKWHLDCQYLDPATGKTLQRKNHQLPPVGASIPDGPVDRGFDYFHGFHHARDMPAVIENDRVIEHDDEVNMLPRLTRKAVEQIDAFAAGKQPFFLYVPLGSPHTPILPTPEWQGKSGLGDYADFVMQTDHALGEIMAALDRHDLADNTLLIFTSDNGCSKAAGIERLSEQGHLVSGPYRGSKADLWDGGHRVPFITRWPKRIQAGASCDHPICLTDLFATTADILLTPLPDGAAEDSVSFLPELAGLPVSSARDGIVHHSISGHFGYRQGRWKLLLARGSGGWSSPNERQAAKQHLPAVQLYDLSIDPGEQHNLAEKYPDRVATLVSLLERDVARGRSTQGPTARNDTAAINLWKSARPPQ